MVDNKKFKPDNYLTETKVSSKPNKNKKGEITSHSYSTVIPKPVLNKLGLYQGQKLYWDINNDNTITITPDLPETQSIEAGFDILNDFIVNGNNNYGTYSTGIINKLKTQKTKEDKITELIHDYKMETREEYKKYYTKVVLYLLDYPLNLPDQYEILQQVYNEITKTD